jgi:hypothetical protein
MAASLDLRFRDGTLINDIASVASDKKVTRRLNRPAKLEFVVPSDHALINTVEADGHPSLAAGYRQISVELDGPGLYFHGIVWLLEDEGDENISRTKVTCYDPMVVWNHRPARDGEASGDAGDFSDPTFIQRNQSGPQIMEEILTQSENTPDPITTPADAEGPLFIDLAASTFAVGGADLSGAPMNFPMSIGEVATLLTNTGELDIYIEPIIHVPGGGTLSNMAEVHCYNGDFGTDLTATVNFDYATGDFNARHFKRSDSMEQICTKLVYYLGPRLDIQHWRSSVTGSLLLPANPALEALVHAARSELGVFMDLEFYDNAGNEASARPLYVTLWLLESLLRTKPREMLYVTPVRGIAPGSFNIGDVITVNIGSKARRATAGEQRIYGFTVTIDDDGVEELDEFMCSPDQDSI